MLASAALLVTAGVLNFGQRLKHETPPWDGVRWTDSRQGIVAETVEAGSSGSRAQILPGDRLIAVSLDNRNYEEVGHAKDVQIYLDQSRVGGNVHYLIERRPTRRESILLRRISTTLMPFISGPARAVHQSHWAGLSFYWLLVLFKQAPRPFALHFLVLPGSFVFHSYTPVGTYRDLDLAIAFLRNAAFILFPLCSCTSVFFIRSVNSCFKRNVGVELDFTFQQYCF